MSTSIVALARELAQFGPVLPVNKKIPMWEGWQNRASREVNGDPEWDAATGVGLLTGERAGYFVVDVDGEHGAATLATWEHEHGKLPATWVSRTGMGHQFFFRCPDGFTVYGNASKIGLGIDIRGERGQVVAPGSRHWLRGAEGERPAKVCGVCTASGPGWHATSCARGLYAWEHSPREVELADAPGWLLEMLRPADAPSPAPISRTASSDRRLQRASAYLATINPAISGAGGHTQTMVAALKVVRGFELSEAEAFDLLASEYNPRCNPPWSEKDLRHKIQSAAKDGRSPWGFLLNAERPLAAVTAPAAKMAGPDDWPALLRFDEVDVPPFPLEALPKWLRDFVEDVAGFAQVRHDMPAMLALASLSTACAGRFHVQVRDGYAESLNLFVAVVMDSGDRKSIVYKVCTQTLRDVEAEMLARARPQIAAAEQRKKNLEARLKVLQGKIAKDDDDAARSLSEAEALKLAKEIDALPPVLKPRLLADDVTPQALGILLQSCGEQIGVAAPEGGIFKTLGGRYSDGQADLDLVLKGYSGEPVTVDRVSRAPIRLNHPLITFALTLQPKVLQDMASMPGAIELGFAGRFLYSLPKSDVGQRAAAAPSMRGDGALELERKIRRLLEGREPGQATEAIRLSPEALAVRDAFHDEVEPRLRPGEGDLSVPGVKEWSRKLVGTMARIAGVLHCAQEPDPVAVPLSGATAEAAVLICRYLIDHARAAFLSMGTDPEIERGKVVLDWIRRKACQRFTLREVFESRRKSFDGKAPLLRLTLELLVAHGYIRPVDPEREGPGRKSEWFEVRPC